MTVITPDELASANGYNMIKGTELNRAYDNVIEMSDSGDDTSSGTSILRPKQTLSPSVAAADALTGKSFVVCRDRSTITNDLTNLLLPEGVSLIAPYAELNGGLQIAGVAHEGTRIVIGNFNSGALTINASATGLLYLYIDTAHASFTMPTIPSGLTVIGIVNGESVTNEVSFVGATPANFEVPVGTGQSDELKASGITLVAENNVRKIPANRVQGVVDVPTDEVAISSNTNLNQQPRYDQYVGKVAVYSGSGNITFDLPTWDGSQVSEFPAGTVFAVHVTGTGSVLVRTINTSGGFIEIAGTTEIRVSQNGFLVIARSATTNKFVVGEDIVFNPILRDLCLPSRKFSFIRPGSTNIAVGSPVAFNEDFDSVLTDNSNVNTFLMPNAVVSAELTDTTGEIIEFGFIENVVVAGTLTNAVGSSVFWSRNTNNASGTGGATHWTINHSDSSDNLAIGIVHSLDDATNGEVTVLFDFRGKTNAGSGGQNAPLLHGDYPNSFNKIYVVDGGDDTKSGLNDFDAVRTIPRAMEIARGMPTQDHKVILLEDAKNYGNLINTATTGNVTNCVVRGEGAIVEAVTLTDHFTSAYPRRVIGNVLLGDRCSLVTNGIDYTAAQTISFTTDEVHVTSRLIATHTNANTTLTFAGVQTGSFIHVEIDRYEADVATCVATIPSGVIVTGYIGSHVFGDAAGGFNYTGTTPANNELTAGTGVDDEIKKSGIVLDSNGKIPQDKLDIPTIHTIIQALNPRSRKLMLGADSGYNFNGNGQIDELHYDQIFQGELRAVKEGTTLTGILELDKNVNGVSWPTNYYYRVDGNTIVPTTDGTDTASSDLRDYMGDSRLMFYHSTEFNEQISDTSKSHTLTYPNHNVGQELVRNRLEQNLQLVFNFPGFNVDVASFTGDMIVHSNSGDKNTLWNSKTRVRFDRVSTGRYTMTLGTSSTFDAAAIKVQDIFHVVDHSINLNSGSHTNQVAVNGEVGFNLPHIPNAQQHVEISFTVAVTES